MNTLLYIIAVLFFILWGIGVFVFKMGIIVHILLFVAFAALFIKEFKLIKIRSHPTFKPMQINIKKIK